MVHPDDLPRFAALGVGANMQPLWAVYEAQMRDLTIPFLGPERSAWQYPFRSLERAGARLVGGSDWSVSTPDVLQELEVAVNRVAPESRGIEPPFLPEERLELASALGAFTIGAAWANGLDEDTRHPGARASWPTSWSSIATCSTVVPARSATRVSCSRCRRGAPSTPTPRSAGRLAAMRERGPIVALDGPGSSGKSSVGAAVAATLGARFLDTGLLYRALTWLCLERGLRPEDGPAVARLADEIDLGPDDAGRLSRVLVAGQDVADRIRTPRVDRAVSAVARQPEVRAALLGRQRAIAAAGGIVVAGRDIGTVVLPDADVKIWLDASAEERAARRARERGIDPASPTGLAILDDLRRRDLADGSRDVSPSRAADDAIHVRTDGNTFEETVAAVLAVVVATGAPGDDAAGRAPAGRSR